jgi:hypothetical protein
LEEATAELEQWKRRHDTALERAKEMSIGELREELANEHTCVVFWQTKLTTAEARATEAERRVEELEGHLSAMVTHCSNSTHGGPMEGMKDQNTRLKWFEALMPIREAARAAIAR